MAKYRHFSLIAGLTYQPYAPSDNLEMRLNMGQMTPLRSRVKQPLRLLVLTCSEIVGKPDAVLWEEHASKPQYRCNDTAECSVTLRRFSFSFHLLLRLFFFFPFKWEPEVISRSDACYLSLLHYSNHCWLKIKFRNVLYWVISATSLNSSQLYTCEVKGEALWVIFMTNM